MGNSESCTRSGYLLAKDVSYQREPLEGLCINPNVLFIRHEYDTEVQLSPTSSSNSKEEEPQSDIEHKQKHRLHLLKTFNKYYTGHINHKVFCEDNSAWSDGHHRKLKQSYLLHNFETDCENDHLDQYRLIHKKISHIIDEESDSVRVIVKYFNIFNKLQHIRLTGSQRSNITLSKKLLSSIIELLKENELSPKIITQGCKIINSSVTYHPDMKSCFGTSGMCEFITATIQRYVNSNEGEVLESLFIIASTMCTGCEENKIKLGNSSMKESIIYILKYHNKSELLIESIFEFISIVTSKNHPNNQTLFAYPDLIDIFLHSIEYFYKNVQIPKLICGVLSSLTSSHRNNQNMFGNHTLFHTLVTFLKKYFGYWNIIPSVCEAIWYLCKDNHAENQSLFLCNGLAQIIFPLLDNYYQHDQQTTETICLIIHSIGYQNMEFQEQFHVANGSQLLDHILHHYSHSETIVMVTCDALCAMVVGHHQNQYQTMTTGIAKTLLGLLERYRKSSSVMEKLFATVWALSANNHQVQQDFLGIGWLGITVDVMKINHTSPTLIRVIFGTIWSLLSGKAITPTTTTRTTTPTSTTTTPTTPTIPTITTTPTMARMLTTTTTTTTTTVAGGGERSLSEMPEDAIRRLLSILWSTRWEPAVVVQGFWALKGLSSHDIRNQSLITKHYGCELLVDLIHIHQSVNEVVAVGLEVIWLLTFHNENNRIAFGKCGVCELIISLLSNETIINSRKITEALCGVIGSISLNNKTIKNKFKELCANKRLMKVLRVYENDNHIIELASDAIASICYNRRNKNRDHSKNLKKLDTGEEMYTPIITLQSENFI